MIYAGVIIGIIIMAAMIYMAVGKKSDKKLRLAAVIALGLMILSVIISVIVIFTTDTVQVDPSTLIVGQPPEVKEKSGSSLGIIVLIIFLIAVFIIVAILAIREARKTKAEDSGSKPISKW